MQRETNWLDHLACRDISRGIFRARDLKHPLNTLVTFNPWPDSLPPPEALITGRDRLLSHIRMWSWRHLGEAPFWVYVWHAYVTGRGPHIHVFMHCPNKHRDALREALEAVYPEPRVIDVCARSDRRKYHHPSGFWGSTPDYLMRFQSQQAWWGGGKKNYRASYVDPETGTRKGTKAPLKIKRWGCTRNISKTAIDAYWAEKERKAA